MLLVHIQIYFICKSFFESFEMVQWQNISDVKKFMRLLWRCLYTRVQETMVFSVASALSYTTLLAVVPLFAIALSIFAAFPMYDDVRAQVQDFLIHYFVPNFGENVEQYMQEFIGATTQLTSMGVIGLAVTAILLLYTIENSFNFIFKVKKHRRLSTKITMYWTIITLCPLLLGVAFSLKGYLLTLQYFKPDHIVGYTAFTTIILPNLFTFAVLLLSYLIIPNKKIRLSSALWGAAIAFVCMIILRIGFGYFLSMNITYKTLYGALATIPIMLVWMYSWWAVVLSGAVITATLEDFKGKRRIWRNKSSAAKSEKSA